MVRRPRPGLSCRCGYGSNLLLIAVIMVTLRARHLIPLLSPTSSVSGPRPASAGWRHYASNRTILPLRATNIMMFYNENLAIPGLQ